MKKIVITTTSFGEYNKMPLILLKERGVEIKFNPYSRKLEKNEVVELCKNSIGIIAGTEALDADTLEYLAKSAVLQPSLKVISRCGTGLDNIDLDAAKRLGIKVFNTPDAPTGAVAELTVGLILNLLRKVNQMDTGIRNGKWEKLMGNLLYGKMVGIVGFGRIGRKVTELLGSFGCEIRYYDIRTEDEELRTEWKGLRTEFEELLKTCDILSLHVSSGKQIIGENEIRMMKKGAWLVNVSRGAVVNEEALYQALKANYLSGVALDVFEQEPYTGPLKELDNVILTPHIGSYAKESRVRMEIQAVENLLRGLRTELWEELSDLKI